MQAFPKQEEKQRTDKVLVLTGLDAIHKQLGFSLSGRQQKLLSFACAIAQDKPYMVSDEPTSMVDILTKEKIWGIIKSIRQEKAFLLSSHDMSEVQTLCNQIVVLNQGLVVYSGKPSDIPHSSHQVKMIVSNPALLCSYLNENQIIYELQNDTIEIVYHTLSELFSLMKDISKITAIENFHCEHPSIQEGVISLVK